MPIGLLTLHIALPGCASLKEKRGRLKPLLARLHREFNVSAAELGDQDIWGSAVIGCALLSNDAIHTRRALQTVSRWVQDNWPDVDVVEEIIETQ
jgi:uncharacterized protein YlxP (DUF503 family)